MRIVVAGSILGLLISGAAYGEPPAPIGGQFQLNSYTTSYQEQPAIAVAPSGGGATGHFIVTWSSEGSLDTDTSSTSVRARLFNPNDIPQDVDFQANTYTTAGQGSAAVAVAPNGNFVVIWSSIGSAGTDTSSSSIHGQRFDRDGVAQGEEFQVNTYTSFVQASADVAMAPDGSFVVVWHGDDTGGLDIWGGIRGQRFASDGSPQGGELQVNTYTTGYQLYPAVAIDGAGDFVVVWQSDGSSGSDTSNDSVQGQRFAADGSPKGSQFQVNSTTSGPQYDPDVSMAPNGAFAVVWSSRFSEGTDSDLASVHGQRFGDDGEAQGDEFQINSYTTGQQRRASIAMSRSRDYLVVWQGDGNSANPLWYHIRGQWIDASGAFLGEEFQINTDTTNLQSSPDVAVAPNGDFVVVWTSVGSAGSDTDLTSIQARRYAGFLLADGFEDGSVLLWTTDDGADRSNGRHAIRDPSQP